MYILKILYFLFFLGGITSAHHLLSTVIHIGSCLSGNLQYYALWSIGFCSIIQAICGSFVVFISTFMNGGIGTNLRCRLDGGMTYLADLTTMNLLLLMYLHQTFMKQVKFNKTTNVLLTFLCWFFGLIWAFPPAIGYASYTPTAGNTFCCLNWTSQKYTDRIFLNGLLCVAYSTPTTITVICFIFQKKQRKNNTSNKKNNTSNKNNNTSNKILVSNSAVMRISLIKIVLSSFYSATVIIKIYGYEEWVTDNVALFAMFFNVCNFIVVPTLLTTELNTELNKCN